jgi:hypothetical protein
MRNTPEERRPRSFSVKASKRVKINVRQKILCRYNKTKSARQFRKSSISMDRHPHHAFILCTSYKKNIRLKYFNFILFHKTDEEEEEDDDDNDDDDDNNNNSILVFTR